MTEGKRDEAETARKDGEIIVYYDKFFYEAIEKLRMLMGANSVADLSFDVIVNLYESGDEEYKAYIAGLVRGIKITLETSEEEN